MAFRATRFPRGKANLNPHHILQVSALKLTFDEALRYNRRHYMFSCWLLDQSHPRTKSGVLSLSSFVAYTYYVFVCIRVKIPMGDEMNGTC